MFFKKVVFVSQMTLCYFDAAKIGKILVTSKHFAIFWLKQVKEQLTSRENH